MQAEYKKPYLYIYSGRYIQKNQNLVDDIGKSDSFTSVHCILAKHITSVDVDHHNYTITIHVKGRAYPIYCSFGERNCYKINCHSIFLSVLAEATEIDIPMVYNLNCRNEQTALSVQRQDES